MRLSVCLIVRDEERFLPECLHSVRDVADEIIVVDTGSRDNTAELARRMGCQVLTFPWEDNFAAARNYALEYAKGEWILSIDADEQLQNPEILRQTLAAAPPEVGGFLVYCHSPADSPGLFSTFVLRLFRRHERIRFRGRIHEQVTVAEAGYQIALSDIALWHQGYAQGKHILQSKHERNLRLLKQALEEEPTNAYLWLQYARSALVIGQATEATQALDEALRVCPPESPLRFHIYYWKAQTALADQRPTEALQYALKVLQAYPYQTMALSIAGEAYAQRSEWHYAAIMYERLQKAYSRQTPSEAILGILRLSPAEFAFRLGRCYIMLGLWDKAEELLRRGREEEPTHDRCTLALAHLLITRGRFQEADSLIRQLRHRPIAPDLLAELVKHRQRRYRASIRSRPLLSLSMIVRNEAERLPMCLESVRPIVDEIVIVDTGSEDATPDIARRYGACVYSFPWKGDFSAARNEALRHCSGEWILYLDADEQLHPESLAIVRDFLQDLPEDVGGVICTIESPHRREDGQHEIHRGVYPRIFRNYGYPTIQFQGRVHEQISPSLLALGKQIVGSPLRILHTGYDQPLEVLRQKVYRNYQLLLQHVQEEPLNAYAWFQLGQTLARMGILQEAEEALRFALQIGTLSNGIAISTAIVLAQLCLRSERLAEALAWTEYALHKAPHHTYALLLKAQALRLLGRLTEAAEVIDYLEQLPDTTIAFPSDAAVSIVIPRHVLQQERALLQSSMKSAITAANPLSG